jgi:hypothetical protein
MPEDRADAGVGGRRPARRHGAGNHRIGRRDFGGCLGRTCAGHGGACGPASALVARLRRVEAIFLCERDHEREAPQMGIAMFRQGDVDNRMTGPGRCLRKGIVGGRRRRVVEGLMQQPRAMAHADAHITGHGALHDNAVGGQGGACGVENEPMSALCLVSTCQSVHDAASRCCWRR